VSDSIRVKIGPYEILGELGRGGMGIVHRARGPDGQDVAIKLLLQVDPSSLARFEREQRILGELGARNGFVPLLGSGVHQGRPYVVMPYLPGGTLKERLRRGPLPVAETRTLGVALARAVGAAHERGIVHRDLKPANVLFDARGLPLVSDLGIAKEVTLGDTTGTGSASSQGLGTLGYMPPEQVNDSREAGFPADVFALGAILYECLAGRKAFEGGLISFARVVAEGPLPLAKVRPEAPADLALAIERALAARPGERFSDANALARALEETRRARVAPLLALALLLVATAAAPVAWRARAASSRRAAAREALAAAHRLERDLDHKGARAELDKAIELDPLLADAWGYRGGVLVQLGEVDAARGDVARALEIDRDCAVAYECRGEVEYARNEDDAAIADFTRSLELDPRLRDAWNNRGVARLRKGNVTAAIADMTRTIELDPTSGDGWFNRAACERLSDPDRALADATRAVELQPRLPQVWQLRAFIRLDRGDRDGSLSDIGRAIELAPKDAPAWRFRGALRQAQGDTDGALADFTRAIELAPAVAESWGYRAAIHLQRGEREAALADYERYVELAGDAALPEARATLEKLRSGR
jgi:tetratricopeptide (TPR) repeat protein